MKGTQKSPVGKRVIFNNAEIVIKQGNCTILCKDVSIIYLRILLEVTPFMISGDKLSYKSHQLGTSLYRKNMFGEGPTLFLHQAEREKDGSLQHCQVLVNLGTYVNTLDADGRKALFYAVRYEKEDIIELLLNKGPT